jgi:hypothetical protein
VLLHLFCPVSNFPFVARDRRRKSHRERAEFFFLLLPGTGGGSYTGNGQSFFFPVAARDRRRKLHRELFFPFVARDRRRKLHRERAEFFFLLLPGIRGGSYTGNFFSFCCQGQEEEVTQGTGSVFFSFCSLNINFIICKNIENFKKNKNSINFSFLKENLKPIESFGLLYFLTKSLQN